MGTRSYEFGKRLVEAGHEVTVLCGSSHLADVPEEVDGMRIIQIQIACSNRDNFLKRVVSFVLFSLSATWKALRLDYDVVYATSTPLTVGIPALAAKWFRGKKFIFEVRDLWPELPKAMGIIRNRLLLSLLEWFEAFCYRSADACVGLSPGIVEGIREKKPRGDVVLIPNACDLEMFGNRRAFKDIEASQVQHSASGSPTDETTFTAVFCGAHGRANGLDAVLDVAGLLMQRSRPDIGLVFIGDGQLKPALVERVEREGLENCVFIDPIPKTELANLLLQVDLGLMILADVPAFRYGTSPNKFFDYIASGLPVLCNYPGWVSDLIAEWDCGVSVAPGDAETFANALIECADRPERLQGQGTRARELAEAEFDRDQLFQRLNQVIIGMEKNV